MKILFLSPEAVPFAKTGGLADVAGALPVALRRMGADVRSVLPYYCDVKDGNFERQLLIRDLKVPLGPIKLSVNVLEAQGEDGLPVYLIEREDLYDRPHLYGNAMGDYYDNLERFTVLSHAALLLAERLSFRPHVIHCHDWQTGLVPALLKGPYRRSPFLAGTPSVFTIHNIGYQGIFPEEKFPLTGLSRSETFHPEGIEYWGKFSLLKAGIVYSKAVTTVSPKYSQEIQTPEYGLGMEGILRRRKAFLHGILNGVDYSQWDPAGDEHIATNYSGETLEGKQTCKEALIEEMNLDPGLMNRPLLAMVTRLDKQKGLDLFLDILDDVLGLDVGLVILGSGDDEIQEALRDKAVARSRRMGIFVGFSDPLAHRIIAGADLFLIPSRYEPCGLTQMYALRYGTVPVVRATGGLEDTVTSFDPQSGRGNGFKFTAYEPAACLAAIREAVGIYESPNAWNALRANGMREDFSWARSARRYLELYESLLPGKLASTETPEEKQ